MSVVVIGSPPFQWTPHYQFSQNLSITLRNVGFKIQILEEIRKLASGEPFDPLVFRLQLLQDIEQKFQQFKEDLALALDGSNPLPSFPHTEEIQTPEKTSWLDKKLF